MKALEFGRRQGVFPFPFGIPCWPGCTYSQKLPYTTTKFTHYGGYQLDHSLQTFSISGCCNDVNILWQPFYLLRQVHFFLEKQVPFMSYKDRTIQEQITSEGSYIDVDPGIK